MKLKGPHLTLLAGLVLAIVIFILNIHATKIAKQSAGTPSPVAAVTTTPSPGTGTPTASAPPTGAPSGSPTGGATAPAAPAVPAGTYAGYTDGGAASIAIAVHKGVAIAYLCSGKIESWLHGPASNSPFTMTGTHSGKLTATLTGTKLTGTVTAGGKTFLFTIKAVKAPSGLYRAAAEVRKAQVVGGWIVLENGYQIGMIDYGTGKETLAPALPASKQVSIDGGTLTAAPIDGESGAGF